MAISRIRWFCLLELRSAILGGTSVFPSMAAPLSSAVPASQAVKVEDKGNIDIAQSGQVHRDQCYKNVRNQVQRLKDLMKSQRATGRAQPAPPPPVQHPPPQPPPPPQPSPPPPPANRTWTKRPATGPPPALAGFRQPPQKQHHLQPASNAHCTPPPPGMPPVNTSKPPLHPSYSAKPFAVRRAAAAAAQKPSVVCGACDVWCMSVFHLKQHERGRKHRDKVASIAGEKNVQCQVCNVQLASELNVVQHYAGKQHRQRLQLRGANGTTGNQATWHDDGTYQ